MSSILQTFYRVYKMSSSVDVYRHCILEGRHRDLTEILLKSINGSSFPLNFKFGKRGRKGKKERDACCPLCLCLRPLVSANL